MRSTLTVGGIISSDLRAVPVLEQLGINCKQHVLDPIEQVCREAGLDFPAVFAALLELDNGFEQCGMGHSSHVMVLLEFLEKEQQRLSGTELSETDRELALACDHVGQQSPSLGATAKLFFDLQWELLPHLITEQYILFPQIRAVLQSAESTRWDAGYFTEVADAIRVGEAENNFLLCRLHQLENSLPQIDFAPLATTTARRLSESLRELCEHVRQHIQLEDQLLFPTVLKERPHFQQYVPVSLKVAQ